MEEKKCPVDRGKLLIGLEYCRDFDKCKHCPYSVWISSCGGDAIARDALAYIYYLEERLGVMG